MSLNDDHAQSVREKTVQRFVRDYKGGVLNKSETDRAIKHLYSPDLGCGWGVHVVQEVKLLAKKEERDSMDSAIQELVQCCVSRYVFTVICILLVSIFLLNSSLCFFSFSGL